VVLETCCSCLSRLPKPVMECNWEQNLERIKSCCLRLEEDQTPQLINRLVLKRLRFWTLSRSYQSEVILDLMRNNRNSKAEQDPLQSILVAQFPFCELCVRRIYGLTRHRWSVFRAISDRDPNQRRLLRSDIDVDRGGFKTTYFEKYLTNIQV